MPAFESGSCDALKMIRLLACAALPVILSISSPAEAQAPVRYKVQRLSAPVTIDGRSDEPAWRLIAPLPAVSSFPEFGAAPSERTEIRIAYDDDYLYFAARMFDRDVAGIRATSLRRDDGSFSNDWFAVNLDTFRDRENTLVTGVNPAGARTDVAFSGDGTAGNFTWNTFWDASAVVAEDGWHAEIRLPLSSLRFEESDGAVIMGMTVWRRIARKNEMITWPAVDHRWGTFSIFKASQMAEIELAGVSRSNPVYVTPYLLSGASRVNSPREPGTGFVATDRYPREAGLDLKYSPASNLTVDLTLNTDFAQVEADDQQVNLSRASVFFPEKRLFFQERASIFEYGLGGNDQLFYSRRIGLEGGEPVRIFGGVRMVGRVHGWDVGLLSMQTDSTPTRRSENASVLRVRRRVLNDNSYAGAMLTSRLDMGGSRRLAGGGDAILRIAGQDYLSLALATSSDTANSLGGTDQLFARARLDRRVIYGLLYNAEAAHVGQEFSPSLGFLGRRDHARGAAQLGYGIRMPQGSGLLRTSFAFGGVVYRRYMDGALETVDAVAELMAETRSGRALSLSLFTRHEDLPEAFSIATGISIPPGAYDFTGGRLMYSPPGSALLRVNAGAEAGSFYDGRRVSVSVSPTWNPSRHLQLSGAYQANRLQFDVRDEHLTTHITRVRTQVMVNSAWSGIVFAQYNSATDGVVLNGRVRWNPREGNDLYLVYNHGLNADRFSYDPVRPFTDNRTLLVKYSHTAVF